MFLFIISRLHDILLLSCPVKMNMDVLKIGIEYKNFRRILAERNILSKILDFMRIQVFHFLGDFRSGYPATINCLNKLFKKDSTITKYQHLAAFETFRRPLNNVTTGVNKDVNPISNCPSKSKYVIALKLYRQFVQPSANKLIKLINSTGEHWENNEKFKIHTKNVSDDESPARRVV